MTLKINGNSKEIEAEELDVASLLNELGLAGKPVVVELNQEPVFPAEYETTSVNDGSSVEIVMIAAGG